MSREISVAIVRSHRAYLPEAEAYQAELRRKGMNPSIVSRKNYAPELFDVVILFAGFHPFWRNYSPTVICEYHSLSTGSLGGLKDILKTALNVRGNLTIFLNPEVRKRLPLLASQAFIFRGMGHSILAPTMSEQKEFDIAYVGNRRPGLYPLVLDLASKGFRVLMIGNHQRCLTNEIEVTGNIPNKEVPGLLARANFGLNYVPNMLPYSVQDSTKLIEYCAAGMKVLTSDYTWVREFEKSRGGKFYYLTNSVDPSDLDDFEFITPNVADLYWPTLLQRAHFAEEIIRTYGRNK